MANDDPSSTPPPEVGRAEATPVEAPPQPEASRSETPRSEPPRSDGPREQRGGGRRDHRRGRNPKGNEPRKPRLPQRDVAEDEPFEPRAAAAGEEAGESDARRLDLAVLKEMGIQKLIEVAKELEIPGASSMKSQPPSL